jgi:hypothetical protein
LCAAAIGSALRNQFSSGGPRRSRLSVVHPGEVSLRAERMATDNRAYATDHTELLLVRFEGMTVRFDRYY